MSTGELKIVVAGPCGAGKTEMANILSSVTKGFTGNLEPTVGLRVLEFQQTLDINQMQQNIVIQLWDMSGDDRYSLTWPAIAKDADGLLLVYNGYEKKQGAALEKYCRELGKELTSKQILVVAHKIGETDEKVSRPKLPKGYEDARVVAADAKENFNAFVDQFDTFSAQVYQIKLKKIEEKEKKMIGEPVPKKQKREKHVEEKPEQAEEGEPEQAQADE